MSHVEELFARVDAPISERELTRMARVAASTERVAPPQPRRSSARRAAVVAAAVAAVASSAITGSVLGWSHASGGAHATASGATVSLVRFPALALLLDEVNAR